MDKFKTIVINEQDIQTLDLASSKNLIKQRFKFLIIDLNNSNRDDLLEYAEDFGYSYTYLFRNKNTETYLLFMEDESSDT